MNDADYTPYTPLDFTPLLAPRLVIKKVLGHTEGQDITAVYDRASYGQEKREALEAWAKRVEEIVR